MPEEAGREEGQGMTMTLAGEELHPMARAAGPGRRSQTANADADEAAHDWLRRRARLSLADPTPSLLPSLVLSTNPSPGESNHTLANGGRKVLEATWRTGRAPLQRPRAVYAARPARRRTSTRCNHKLCARLGSSSQTLVRLVGRQVAAEGRVRASSSIPHRTRCALSPT